jgi:hypothetical protein
MARTQSGDPHFTRRWLGATFLGWLLGFVFIIAIALLSELSGRQTQFPVGLGMGLGVGLLQNRILAQYLAVGRKWTYASAAGLTIPFLVTDFDYLISLTLPYSLPLTIVVGGLVVGLLQTRILLRGGAALMWIPACTLGWALAGSTVFLNENVMPRTLGIAGALLYVGVILLGGVVLGAATGPVLERILKQVQSAPGRLARSGQR